MADTAARSLELCPARDKASTLTRGLFLGVAGLTLIGSVWALGSEPLGAQWWLLRGAVATFLTGALARIFARRGPTVAGTMAVEICLLGLGLLLLGLLWYQAANPSLRVVLEGNLWRLEPIPGVKAGPHSLMAPFDFIPGDFMPYKNAWRFLLIFGAVWLYSAGLVLGFVDRIDAKRWVALVGLNGGALAVVCIVHRAMQEKLTLWHFQSTFDFTGSPVFFYKNHNGAYLAATMAVVLGLAASADRLGRRHAWETVALLLWIATFVVNSRVATGCSTLFGLFYVVHVWRRWVRAKTRIFTWRRITIALGLLGVVASLLFLSGGQTAVQRFAEAGESPADFIQGGNYRVMLREVALEMWRASPVWGWGGGSFLYLYNTFHVRVPELAAHVYAEQPQLNRFFGPTANCDWIEFLAEYGAVGLLLMTSLLATVVNAWCRRAGYRDGLTFFLAVGVGGVLLHAFFDYILRNPAILTLGAGVVFAGLRYLRNEEPSSGGYAMAEK